MSNYSETNFKNVVKISIQAMCVVNFTISLSNSGVYTEKIKIRYRLPIQTPKENLKHQIEVYSNPC